MLSKYDKHFKKERERESQDILILDFFQYLNDRMRAVPKLS